MHVVLKNIPAGEDQIVEPGQGYELFDLGRTRIGALAQANRSHLCERADGLGDSLADGFDAGHEGGCHCTHTRDHDTELALGGLNLVAVVLAGFSFCGLLPSRHRVEASLSEFLMIAKQVCSRIADYFATS